MPRFQLHRDVASATDVTNEFNLMVLLPVSVFSSKHLSHIICEDNCVWIQIINLIKSSSLEHLHYPHELSDIEYTDDITILDNSVHVINISSGFEFEASQHSSQFALIKCKLLIQDCLESLSSVHINFDQLEVIKSFIYPGVVIQDNSSIQKDISCRISLDRLAFWCRFDVGLPIKVVRTIDAGRG